jgi:GDP-L-fucose synthase
MSSKDCDLTKYHDTYSYFSNIQPTIVIHLAANVGGLFKNLNQKVDMFEKNIHMNMNVLRVCHALDIQNVISCLSTCIFPDNIKYPINESMLHNGPPHHSNDGYAYAKRMLEVQSKMYQQQYGRNFRCIIPTNIYGEHDNYSLQDGHVIPALIHKCYLAKQNNIDFQVKGSGTPLRQFIYSKDLAKLIMWVVGEYTELDSIILSPKEEVSIRHIAECIAKEFDILDRIVFDNNSNLNGQFKKTADNQRLLELHGEFNFISIETGIRKSVEWFIDHYDICRK